MVVSFRHHRRGALGTLIALLLYLTESRLFAECVVNTIVGFIVNAIRR